MAIPVYTGLGTTVTLLGDLDVVSRWRFTSISGYGVSNEPLDDTYLDADHADPTERFLRWVPSPLNTVEDQVFEAYWEMDQPFPGVGELVPGLVSWQLPPRPNSFGGGFSASGWISASETGTFDPEERTIGTITFKIDNQANPPSWTPGG